MIPVYKPFLSEKVKNYVNECLDDNWISSKGKFIGLFEKAFCDYTGASYATSVCNGTVALHLALKTLNIQPGDEVIVPSLTYIASVNAILAVGATPIFVDSYETTWQMNVQDIRDKITHRTRAIMAVHLYGHPCAMKEIADIAKLNNLYVIEDCAESFGAYYQGKHTGTFGDIATFSFFGNKTITTGEGGMVVCQNEKLYEKACHLKNQGVSKEKEYWHDEIAYNYRMTNICAAIGLAQLESAQEILQRKRQIAEWYKKYLENLPLITHQESENTTHSYWMCSILLDDAVKRDPIRKYLKENNIETRPFFFPAHTMPHCKQDISLPIAEAISRKGINLPSYPELKELDVLYIVNVIKHFHI